MIAAPFSLPVVLPAVLAVLVGWRIYRGVRRLIGRQPVRVRRLVLTAVFFPILLALVSLTGLRDVRLLEGVGAGIVIGLALAWLGLKLTRFEKTAEGCFFVPNTTIGVGISVLFIGRLVYRFGALYLAGGSLDPNSMQSFGSSPLTLAIFGVVATYYTAYAIGILAWYRRVRDEAPTPALGTPVA